MELLSFLSRTYQVQVGRFAHDGFLRHRSRCSGHLGLFGLAIRKASNTHHEPLTSEGAAHTHGLRREAALTCSYVHGPTRTMCNHPSELRTEIRGKLHAGRPRRRVGPHSQSCVPCVGGFARCVASPGGIGSSSVAKPIFNLAATTAPTICFIAGSVSYLRPIR